MEKKTSIIIAVVIFLIAALVAGFYELVIDKDIKENIDKKTTSIKETKNTEEKQDKKDDEMMDGVTLNYQSSIRIEKNNEIIYFDPYKITDSKNDANYIFITHSHYDHFSKEDIKKVMNDNTKFVVTSDIESDIKALGVSDSNILVTYPNETHEIGDLTFDAIPSYNISKSYHKKSYNWVGYNVIIDGTSYFTVGDSDVTDELKNVKCDVIFVPVGGTYTMTDSEASKLVNEIKPKYAVPVHYGEVGSDKNASNFVSQLDSDIKGIILK
jgi:L-ascorbate metabolism protein UlaG (beta-lactamase superfamily)